MNKRQRILQYVFIDCCRNGKIKDSLGLILENRINIYAEDTQEIARKGVNIFNNNTQEEIKNLPISQLKTNERRLNK